MVKINRGYKSKNSNKTQKAIGKTTSSSSSSMISTPTKSEEVMNSLNNELQKLEEERVTCERYFKQTEEEITQVEFEDQQRIFQLDELREQFKDDPRLSTALSGAQMHLAESQKTLMLQREERKEWLKKQRNTWMEREEEIYRAIRKEAEDEQSI